METGIQLEAVQILRGAGGGEEEEEERMGGGGRRKEGAHRVRERLRDQGRPVGCVWLGEACHDLQTVGVWILLEYSGYI